MRLLRNIFINLFGTFFKKRFLRKAVDQLSPQNDRTIETLISALNQTLNNSLNQIERENIKKIETLRKQLHSRFEKIEIANFGARTELNHSEIESQNQNAPKTRTVSKLSISSKSEFWATLLFKIIREFKPETCIELGTNMGISAAYQALALRLNNKGQLTTLEGSKNSALMASRHLKDLGLDQANCMIGKFADILPDLLEKLTKIDYAFIDGHHDRQATLNYYEMMLPHLSENAVLVFDDISWSAGMKVAWKTISHHKRVKTAENLYVMGICLIAPETNAV